MILSYNNQPITQREIDGYVNATEMCQANGKLVADWMRTKETKAYIDELSSVMGIPITQLVISKRGNSSGFSQGTWIHPRLAICLGRWVSVSFSIWCDEHIRTLIETGKTGLVVNPFGDDPALQAFRIWNDRMTWFYANNEIPYTHWCVFVEISEFIGRLARQNCPLPSSCVPDISVGKCWMNYLKKEGGYNFSLIQTYPHKYPDHRGIIQANIYPNEWIPIFKTWFHNTYKPINALEYFRKSYPQALPTVCQLLGLPEGK